MKKQNQQAPVAVGEREVEQFKKSHDIARANADFRTKTAAPVKPGTQIMVNVRAVVREVGPESCVVELTELRDQGRVGNPIYIFVPHEAIRPTPKQPKPLPPQIPD